MRHTAPIFRGTAVAAAVLLAGCGSSPIAATGDTPTTATSTTTTTTAAAPAPAIVGREQARAAHAVDVLAGALRDGDVERLCRPGAVFTSAVVAGMNGALPGCEQDVELSSVVTHPPTLTVVQSSSYEPDLATLRVRVGRGATVPLDVVRERGQWLVSFSDGNDPLGALAAA